MLFLNHIILDSRIEMVLMSIRTLEETHMFTMNFWVTFGLMEHDGAESNDINLYFIGLIKNGWNEADMMKCIPSHFIIFHRFLLPLICTE